MCTKDMNTGVPFDTAPAQEPAAFRRKGMKATALFSALLGCLSVLPLSSAAEAAPFQQYKNGACSASSKICTIDFAVVPAGKRLDIIDASCYLRVSGAHELYAMQFLVMQGTATQSALTLQPQYIDDVTMPFESVYSANHSTIAFANAGQRLRAYVELSKGTYSQFACHISGQLQSEL
ncbi:MAG TPA: hypothetical protein VFF88_09235 [Methylocella sp.]|nr:hypothetical protein [Methylocella sp.]